MTKTIRNFYNEHPYLTIVISVIIGSIIGILIEYILNQDFYLGGFSGAFIVILTACLIKRHELK
ncbi:hypothetical protein YA5_004510 [Tetragenococcus halophilus]|nr:hypothetical protein YA163_04410 [Tetragenococcus halophilus]GFK28010.1 hypothetical protein YG2_04440 [Tetragenococcus halophilus]GLL50478.1 hypothetical protein YA5_004510 [Tetragenococcus halophilus]